MIPQMLKDKRDQEEALGDDQIALQAEADDQDFVPYFTKTQKKRQRRGRKDYN